MPYAHYKPYRYQPFLIMLYMTLITTVSVLSNKIITIDGHITMAGTLFIPFWFLLSDIITEIYGYKISRKVIWLGFFCHFIFSVLCTIALTIPSPAFWHGQSAYQLVLGDLIRINLSGVIAYIISGTLNIYLLTQWKFLLKGKYFWLRSFFASTIGELIYTILAVIMIQYHILTWNEMKNIIITSYSIKILCTLFSTLPANVIVNFLKINEVTPYVKDTINPFKRNIGNSDKQEQPK